jgi:hypothetical protein
MYVNRPPVWEENRTQEKLDDLTKVGYSPEVALAIIENEKKIIDSSIENQL